MQPIRNFSPKAAHLGYSVRRYFVDEFYFRHMSLLPPDSRVLDLGGVRTHKRGHFDISHFSLSVVYANLSIMKGTDVQADAAWIPFHQNCFDTVICAELLEHVPDPRAILAESFRVLREAGELLVIMPFLFRIHAAPHDFARYTDYFWQLAMQEAGFQRIEITRQGLFYSVLADFLKQYANRMRVPRPFGRLIRWCMAHVVIARFQNWAFEHEKDTAVQANAFLRSYTTGFEIRGIKP